MAKKDVAGIVGGAGLIMSIATKVVNAARTLGAVAEDFYRLATPEGDETITQMAKLLVAHRQQVKSAVAVASPKTFTVPVDYTNPGHRTINKEEYYYVNSDLRREEHFPINGTGQSDQVFEYVEFDHEPTTQKVLDEIERKGLRRPDFAESRYFLKANPKERLEAPVVALCGAFVELYGHRCVACVGAGDRGVELHFSLLGLRWLQRCRFLAVRK